VKCPKCGYLGFDSGDRCRNCGYEFALMRDAADGTPAGGPVPRRTPPAAGHVGDPSLRDPGLARGARYRRTDGSGHDAGVDRKLAGQAEGTPIDLPLFGDAGGPGLLPPPRPPLQVRRATPAPGRLRPRPDTPRPEALRLDLEAAAPAPAPVPVPAPSVPESACDGRVAALSGVTAATAGRRVAAASIDLALSAALDLGVLYFTLRLCELSTNDVHLLPAVPLVAFFVLLNGGYFILLTGTLGQTLGKMVAGIEVVSDRRGRMDIGRSTLRAAAAVLAIAPAGLGWAAGLIGERRALHDRLTRTRVIQISAS
jgi:uncharacterized RDD family membrane protein YckC